MTQVEMAKWSGRRTVSQNAAYDHTSPAERLQMIRSAIGDGSRMVGPMAELPDPLPMTPDEYRELRVPTAIVTEIGACVHDWAMEPCRYFGHCIGCEEHIFTKTPQLRAKISEMLQESERLLHGAKQAESAGHAGSNRWLDVHKRTRDRLRHLLTILEDPSVPDGMQISFPPLEEDG